MRVCFSFIRVTIKKYQNPAGEKKYFLLKLFKLDQVTLDYHRMQYIACNENEFRYLSDNWEIVKHAMGDVSKSANVSSVGSRHKPINIVESDTEDQNIPKRSVVFQEIIFEKIK